MYEIPHLKVQIGKTSSLYKEPSIITATVVEVAAAVNSTTALKILVKATKPNKLGKGERPNASPAIKKELCEQKTASIRGGWVVYMGSKQRVGGRSVSEQDPKRI